MTVLDDSRDRLTKARAHILEEANDYYLGVVERLCKQMPGVERYEALLKEIARLRALAGDAPK